MRREIYCPGIDEAFEKRPYRRCTTGLEAYGVPWIPLVGRNSFLRTITPLSWHAHRGCIEIIYCQRGACEYESCGETYQLKPGSIFVSRPNESHRMMSNPKGLATHYLLFRMHKRKTPDFLGSELNFIERKLRRVPRFFYGGLHVGSQFVRLSRLIKQSFSDRAERRLRILNACLSLLLSVIDASETPMEGRGSSRILAIAEEMRTHPEQDYPVEALSAKIGFSPSSLLNGFKATTGFSPHAYLIKCRIDRAKQLLGGDMSVSDVAGALGFPSPQHFATQFRSATGMSPREWVSGGRS